MSREHAAAIAQAKNLEEISDRNLVEYFRPELIKIGNGEQATSLLPESVLQRFHEIGIFNLKTTYSLSEKGAQVLRELDK